MRLTTGGPSPPWSALLSDRKGRQVDAAGGRPRLGLPRPGQRGRRPPWRGAVRFVNFLATHAGSSIGERRAFVSFALQRLRCATVKGGCAHINERPPSGGGPSRPCRGLLPLPEPKVRLAASRTWT